MDIFILLPGRGGFQAFTTEHRSAGIFIDGLHQVEASPSIPSSLNILLFFEMIMWFCPLYFQGGNALAFAVEPTLIPGVNPT